MSVAVFVALALKSLAIAPGVALFVRAIGRRAGRGPAAGAVDPAVTRGLWLLGGAAAVMIAGGALVLLRLKYGWPEWVRTLGFRAVGGAMVVLFPLAAWLGWRTAREELGPAARPPDERADAS